MIQAAGPTTGADSAVVVRLYGECDASRKEQIRAELQRAQNAALAVVDLSEATYIDSGALGEIVRLASTVLSREGKIRVVVSNPHLKKIFNVLGLTKKIPLCDTLAEACE